jgi:hypothetical protein
MYPLVQIFVFGASKDGTLFFFTFYFLFYFSNQGLNGIKPGGGGLTNTVCPLLKLVATSEWAKQWNRRDKA